MLVAPIAPGKGRLRPAFMRGWRVLALAATLLALLALPAVADAPANVRIALVIGNSAYVAVPVLPNPAHDAEAMADTLEALGFTVVQVRNATRAQMNDAVNRVRADLQGKQGVAVFYYAGHGLQQDSHNFMVPIDARLASGNDIPTQTVDLKVVIDAFKGVNTRMNIVVLDACRDNPFGSVTTADKGLAPLDAPSGTFLAYATAPGKVAEDGDDATGNGLYTRYLLDELRRPAKIEDVFKRVRLAVRRESKGRQIPWESTSLEEDFYFNDGDKYAFKPEYLAALAQAAELKRAARENELAQARERERQRIEQQARDREATAASERAAEEMRLASQAESRRAQQLSSQQRQKELDRIAEATRAKEAQIAAEQTAARERQAALEKERERDRQQQLALERERQEEQARLARIQQDVAKAQDSQRTPPAAPKEAQRQELAMQRTEWQKIRTSRNPDDFYTYLARYPTNTTLTEMAQYRLDRLDPPKIVADLPRGMDASMGYTEARFRIGDTYQVRQSDLYTKVVQRTYSRQVTAVDEQSVTFDGGAFTITPLGAVSRDDRGSYDPPLGGQPAKYQVGYKWHSETTQQGNDGVTYQLVTDSRVTGIDTIEVVAGRFQTYVVESVQQISGSGTQELKQWFNPLYGLPLRVDIIQRNLGRDVVRAERREVAAINAPR